MSNQNLNTPQEMGLAIDRLYEDTLEFNHVAGQLKDVTDESLQRQAHLVFDEAEELVDSSDPENALKEAIDVLVTTLGYLQKFAEKHDVDIPKAMRIVGENNLSKFRRSRLELRGSVLHFLDRGVEVSIHEDSHTGWFSLKDQTGKIRKPVDYEDADLSACFNRLPWLLRKQE